MSPFKSVAQRRWAGEQVKLGKWSQATFDEWQADTPKKLPKRLHKKPAKRTTRRKRR